jgi:hypothetical protein
MSFGQLIATNGPEELSHRFKIARAGGENGLNHW